MFPMPKSRGIGTAMNHCGSDPHVDFQSALRAVVSPASTCLVPCRSKHIEIIGWQVLPTFSITHFFQPAGSIVYSANSTNPLCTKSSRSIWEWLTHKRSERGRWVVLLQVIDLMGLHLSPSSSMTSRSFQSLPSWELLVLVQ